MVKIIYCFVVLSLLGACSNDLSRGKAEEMIKSNSYPLSVAFIDGFGGFEKVWDDNNTLSPTQQEQLREEGYLLKNGFSEKAKPFVKVGKTDVGTVFHSLQLGTVDKVVVNSISKPADMMGMRVCEAKYEIRYKPNALGDKLKMESDKLTGTGKAVFLLTDNGWEIDKK